MIAYNLGVGIYGALLFIAKELDMNMLKNIVKDVK